MRGALPGTGNRGTAKVDYLQGLSAFGEPHILCFLERFWRCMPQFATIGLVGGFHGTTARVAPGKNLNGVGSTCWSPAAARHSSHVAWPFGPGHLPTPLGLSQNRQKNWQTSNFPVDALGPVWQARLAMPECEDRFSLTRAALSASGRATLPIQFSGRVAWLLLATALPLAAAPVIDPIPAATIAAGKSLIVPVTASSANGRPLTFTFTSSTNAIALVPHTNNPFWKLSVVQAAAANAPGAFSTSFRGGTVTVTNVGDMTFMLFPDYAPHTVSVFQGLSASGFYNRSPPGSERRLG